MAHFRDPLSFSLSLFAVNATFCKGRCTDFPRFPARLLPASSAFQGTHLSSTIIAGTDRWMGLQRGKGTTGQKKSGEHFLRRSYANCSVSRQFNPFVTVWIRDHHWIPRENQPRALPARRGTTRRTFDVSTRFISRSLTNSRV